MTLLKFTSFLGSLLIASATASASPPNVIVIVTDDIGYGDVGFHDVVLGLLFDQGAIGQRARNG